MTESEILRKFSPKARAKHFLHEIQTHKNLFLDSEGQFVLDKQSIPARNIVDLLRSAATKTQF